MYCDPSRRRRNGSRAPGASRFRGRTGLYTGFILLGTVIYSIQVLAMVTVMPTVVVDIGGTSHYVWASLLYGVGTIVGGASVGPAWNALGGRRMFLAASMVFLLGTLGGALASDMTTLVAARGVQGFGGGAITAGTMTMAGALVSRPAAHLDTRPVPGRVDGVQPARAGGRRRLRGVRLVARHFSGRSCLRSRRFLGVGLLGASA